ncbi:hypothetical protein ANCDUO_17941 [Ancylostoma duodenale]|uniref:Uncharacterized protein n=1 Tax=Ancylostoma duodenale TaxID=51022 RepID=A0A0C2FZ69_9BILA|nr:hypothetical protein ANCDUO_17941 [Ancylostoma duodenale]
MTDMPKYRGLLLRSCRNHDAALPSGPSSTEDNPRVDRDYLSRDYLVAFFLNICGLSKSDIRRKYIFYKFATYLAILAVLLELTALIVFPACFYVKMKEYGSRRDWEVDWSYGLAWGATLFTFGASLLLICDKEHEEVYYKEKTIYNPPPELMN